MFQPTGGGCLPPAPGWRMNTGGGELTPSLSVAVVSHSMMSADDLSDPPSSPDSPFDDSDLLSSSTVADDVTTQLAAAGPIGVAAAAAIATGKKRKRPHTFETNPSIRKRQQTRLLRKESIPRTEARKFPAVEEDLFKYVQQLRSSGITLPWDLVSPSIVEKSFKKTGLSNALHGIEDDVLWEDGDSGRDDDSGLIDH
ncbi:hypothetical protein HPB52_021487 [Rhipicephalus sanguineus]|uniref:Nuclear respiratory factor 1 NLS/DNA-binding dimerisation domain-containing protein n=1 Tax=Rhipicephalus sanguineus TaxID=34632 RepID=A0A9D4QEE5_RHISA|nr:hypothetical protein HPB52_021487 [Rhipicephalus sanguineus]